MTSSLSGLDQILSAKNFGQFSACSPCPPCYLNLVPTSCHPILEEVRAGLKVEDVQEELGQAVGIVLIEANHGAAYVKENSNKVK